MARASASKARKRIAMEAARSASSEDGINSPAAANKKASSTRNRVLRSQRALSPAPPTAGKRRRRGDQGKDEEFLPEVSDSDTPLLPHSKRSKKKTTTAKTFAASNAASASGNTTQLGSEDARPKRRLLVGVFIPSSKPRLTTNKSQIIESAHTANSESEPDAEPSHGGSLYGTSEEYGYEGDTEDVDKVNNDEDTEGTADHDAQASNVDEDVDDDVEEVDDDDNDEDDNGEELRTSPSRFFDTEAKEIGILDSFSDRSSDHLSDASSDMRDFVVDDDASILLSGSEGTEPLYHRGESTQTTPPPTVKSESSGPTQSPSIKEESREPTRWPTIKSETQTTTLSLDRNIRSFRRTRNQRIVLSDDEEDESNATSVHRPPDTSLKSANMLGQSLRAAQDVAPSDAGTNASVLEAFANNQAAARAANKGNTGRRQGPTIDPPVSLGRVNSQAAVHAQLSQNNTPALLSNIDVPKRKRGRPKKLKVDIPKQGRPKKPKVDIPKQGQPEKPKVDIPKRGRPEKTNVNVLIQKRGGLQPKKGDQRIGGMLNDPSRGTASFDTIKARTPRAAPTSKIVTSWQEGLKPPSEQRVTRARGMH